MLGPELKHICHEIDSQYPQQLADTHKIPPNVIEKYLTVGNPTWLDKFQSVIRTIHPLWTLTFDQFISNIRGIVSSNWDFEQANKSIYLVFWGPLSLVLFCHIFHNSPAYSHIGVVYCGLIDIFLILLTGFAMFVYSNVLNFHQNQFLQHLCVSSYVNLITILFCCIGFASPMVLIIIAAILFSISTTYLHFNLYNKAIKPTLLEFIILLFVLMVLYGCGAYLLCSTFMGTQEEVVRPTHMTQRHFDEI